MNYSVYILTCSDGRTYVGCSSDLKARLDRHNRGQVPATKSRLPIRLSAAVVFSDKYRAFAFEKYLKSGAGRRFMAKRLMPAMVYHQ